MSPADISALIGSYLPEPEAGLLSGMILGTRESLPPELYDALIDTGTLHIVALSGTNVTIMANLTVLTLSPVVGRRIASLLTIGLLTGFIFFVGPAPPIVRAGIMGGISLVAAATGKQAWTLWSFAVACLVMLFVRPSLIFDISFQLSAGATLGLILFGSPALKSKIRLPIDKETGKTVVTIQNVIHAGWDLVRIPIIDGLRTTLAAQTFTTPIIIFHFHRISLISPLSNAMIGMVIAPVTALGVILVFSGLIIPLLGFVIAPVLWLGLAYIIRVILVTGGGR